LKLNLRKISPAVVLFPISFLSLKPRFTLKYAKLSELSRPPAVKENTSFQIPPRNPKLNACQLLMVCGKTKKGREQDTNNEYCIVT
jgi:hypothetical protein